MQKIDISDITIRSELKPGDLGMLVYLHGKLYSEECNYGIQFESYVAESIHEFYTIYVKGKSHIWIAEHRDNIVGYVSLLDRGTKAQLRYFLILPGYRGIGLGKKLMGLFMDSFRAGNYNHAYLSTTNDLKAAAYLYGTCGFKLSKEETSMEFGRETIVQHYELRV